MGRTTPTYRRFLEGYEADWGEYRRALRRGRRDDFDRLFERAAAHAHAAAVQNPPDPLEATYLSMLLAHEAEIRRLRERLAAVEEGENGGDEGDADAGDRPGTDARGDEGDTPG
ncbi:hypothetical protein [Halobaculum sp. EA56]|uniref:hypothetical protein n=1 Tax=Halobaculum sp. EA56 TaxID=3421648 RepID=UPI003EC0B12D